MYPLVLLFLWLGEGEKIERRKKTTSFADCIHHPCSSAAVCLAQVVNAIISAQAQGLGKVEVSDSVSMRLNRTVSVAELRRWRQQFLRMTGSLSGNQVTSAEAAQKLFVEHLKSLGV